MAEASSSEVPSNPPDWLTEFGKTIAAAGLNYAKDSLKTSDEKANLGADQKAAEVKGDLSKTNVYVMAGIALAAAALVYIAVKK